MPLRRRISLVAAATVAVAVAIAVLVSYFAVRNQLVGQIDSELRAEAALYEARYGAGDLRNPSLAARYGGPAPYSQAVAPNGQIVGAAGGLSLPTNQLTQEVASGTASAVMADVTVNGAPLRMYTFEVSGNLPGGLTSVAIQLARPLSSVNNVLSTLKWILAAVFLLVVASSAFLARMATRRVLNPLAEVTATAEAIAETDDLSRRINVREDDEVGQLATRFNEMLERLEHSREQLDASVAGQRQLLADASHELRTPVTSLRTNIEVLLSGAELDKEDRHRLLADVVEQSEELSTLVNDLIEVARGDAPPTTIEDTRLDRLVEEAVDRARRNAPSADFIERLAPISVQGNPERLLRAINNLLDNAALHAGDGGPIEITVDGLGVTVRDHGEGIAEADLPHIFDRFYRGANSRARQGSGLGLAIVRQVAEQHRGGVTAENAGDGGAVFTLRLPTSAVADDAHLQRDAEIWPRVP